MTDREVGELWLKHCSTPDLRIWFWDTTALIRKLVGDRTRWKEYVTDRQCVGPCALAEALRDFGIDPTTWKEGA